MKYLLNTKFNLVNLLLVLLIFLLPFERIPSWDLFGFTFKLGFIFGAVLLLAFLFSQNLMVLIRNLTLSDKILLIIWLYSLVSVGWSVNQKRALFISLAWLFVFLIYLVMKWALSHSQLKIDRFKLVLFTATILASIFGIYQFVGDSLGLPTAMTGLSTHYTKAILGFPRVQSFALEPLYFANFLLVPFFISLYENVRSKKFSHFYFWTTILILTCIILTVSRGAYVALAFSALIFVLYLIFSNNLAKIPQIILIGFISFALSLAAINGLNGKKAGSNLAEHTSVVITATDSSTRDYSTSDRIETSLTALRYFKEAPILGKGLASFGPLATPAEKINRGVFQTVNNQYLEIATELGLIGLALFAFFVITLIKEIKPNYRRLKKDEKLFFVSVLCGIIGIAVQYNFFSTLYILYIWVFLALLASIPFTLKPESV